MLGRRRRSPLADMPADVHILVDGQPSPILAHRHVLSFFSQVARDLPQNDDGSPTSWDLQGLVLEGQSYPVKETVVEQWLDAAYSRVDASRCQHLFLKLNEAKPLLLFADAVGTEEVLLQALGQALAEEPDLTLEVQANDELRIEVVLRDRIYFEDVNDNLMYCQVGDHGGALTGVAIPALMYAPHVEAVRQGVASELEAWLHLAGRLGLVPLVRVLLGFLKAQVVAEIGSLLPPANYAAVFSPRVLHCMPREVLFEAVLRDTLAARPAEVLLAAGHASVTPTSPLAAAWLQARLGCTLDCRLIQPPAQRGGAVVIHGDNVRALTVTVGGPSGSSCDLGVRQALAAALADEEPRTSTE